MAHKDLINSGIFKDKELASFIHTYHKIRNKFSQVPKEIIHSLFKDILIPILIFVPELGSLEAIVKYLRENLGLSFSDISKKLGRTEANVRISYSNSKKKKPQQFEIIDLSDSAKNSIVIPLSIFRTLQLSMLESLVTFLKEELDLKFTDIAKHLHRDQRTIWTIYNRSVLKRRSETKNKIK
ncbi:MAG: hypothetical protein ABIG89_02060 [Candidatus Woesearchaeota archaeon]